jgi:putative DNA primase/helicase
MSRARKPEDMPRDLWGEPEINGQADDYGEYGAYRNPIGNLPESAEFPVGTLPRAGRRLAEESARAIGCPTEFVALPMLVVLGTAIGNSRVLKLKAGWEEGASIYGAVVAEPGEKKSPAASVAIEPAVRLQAELRSKHLNKLDEHKRLLREYEVEKRDAAKAGESAGPPSLEPRMARTVVEDTTVEALAVVLETNPRGVGVFRDELSAWALSHNQYKSGGKGSDRQFWLSAWSNTYASVDRKSRKDPLMLPRPFVGLFGAIQPAILPEIGDGRGDGLLDRFLLAYPHPKPSRWTDDEISREARDDYGSLYRKLRRLYLETDDHGAPNPGKVVFAPDARTVFVEAVDGHRAEMEELGFPARLKGSWSKLEAYLARLSLILALCRCVDDVAPERVENRDVLGAVVLLDYFKVQTRRIYLGLYGEDPLDLLAADLRRLLEERGGFFTGAPTELHQELKSEHKGGQSNVLTRRVRKIQRRSPVLRFEEKKENYKKQDGSRSTRNVVILALRDSP